MELDNHIHFNDVVRIFQECPSISMEMGKSDCVVIESLGPYFGDHDKRSNVIQRIKYFYCKLLCYFCC